ncbi:unnamed protein product [Linum trigynum]|uniref:Uncharacterized protein n=1 Tax=Linum trigynum TaxID=586398 RepID=A0AAV2GCW0_9ROSI
MGTIDSQLLVVACSSGTVVQNPKPSGGCSNSSQIHLLPLATAAPTPPPADRQGYRRCRGFQDSRAWVEFGEGWWRRRRGRGRCVFRF